MAVVGGGRAVMAAEGAFLLQSCRRRTVYCAVQEEEYLSSLVGPQLMRLEVYVGIGDAGPRTPCTNELCCCCDIAAVSAAFAADANGRPVLGSTPKVAATSGTASGS